MIAQAINCFVARDKHVECQRLLYSAVGQDQTRFCRELNLPFLQALEDKPSVTVYCTVYRFSAQKSLKGTVTKDLLTGNIIIVDASLALHHISFRSRRDPTEQPQPQDWSCIVTLAGVPTA